MPQLHTALVEAIIGRTFNGLRAVVLFGCSRFYI